MYRTPSEDFTEVPAPSLRNGVVGDLSDTSENDASPLLTRSRVSADLTNIRELSVRSTIIVIIMSILFGVSNCYLGLFAGSTISVSIPSAIISLAMLKPFKASVMEINLIQTGVSAGASLAAGVVYTLPALVLMGNWAQLRYWETVMISLVGGLLGILFSIPLRRALVIESDLPFPEGVATAEFLKATIVRNRGPKFLLVGLGALLGSITKLGDSAMGLWYRSLDGALRMGGAVFFTGVNLSPALLAVGYIMKLRVGGLIFIGAILNWFVIVPILSVVYNDEIPDREPIREARYIWMNYSRYIGVGAMLTGGLGVLFSMAIPIWRGIKFSIKAYRIVLQYGFHSIARVERDLPLPLIIGFALFLLIPIGITYGMVTSVLTAVGSTLIMFFTGFLFTAVGAYMAGIVGAGNNPISGITLATIMLASIILRGSENGAVVVIMIGSVICTAAAVGGDTMQDLKTGNLLGATPLYQQMFQAMGVIVFSFVVGPVVSLLINAYGLGTGSSSLPAPQAQLMKSVVESMFSGQIPTSMILTGAALALIVIVLDFVTTWRFSVRIPVLNIALGLYLPFDFCMTIFLGGLCSYIGEKVQHKMHLSEKSSKMNENDGLMFASGLITGEALMGIFIAATIAISSDPYVLSIGGADPYWWPGLILLFTTILVQFLVAVQRET
eukprot:TRINITY_DN8018_c0_g1_i1.p1 TRINITY_DN8018_c0_g1~~TRINITY_DN8018_c0_g1_i1.p1  ORF type:complete len:670 (+),score=126.27 TRINITY_DN8018_c0_g1_i1:33-2042(+)